MDELRTEIWDVLFRADAPKSIDDISRIVQRDSETVRAAADHDWFEIVENSVTIAYDRPS